MSLRHGIVRGAFSLGSARLVMSLLNAAGIVVLARILTPDDFGIVAIAMAVVSVIVALTEAALPQALVQIREPTRAHIDTVWTLSLLRTCLILGVMAVAALPLSHAYGDERLFPVFIVAGVTGAFMEFYNPLLTMATRELRFGHLAAFQIGQKFAGLGLAIALALAFDNFWGIIAGNALGAVLASLASYVIIPYRPAPSLSRAHEIWGFSGWMFLNQLCEALNWRFDQLVIGLAASKAELGQYSMADNLAAIPSRELSFPLRNALFPGLTQVADQPDRLRQAFLTAQTGVAMLTAPVAVGLALLAVPMVELLLGPRWAMAAPLLQLLAITYAFDTFITVVKPLGMAVGKTRYLFYRQLAALCVRIPLILGGLLLGGVIGAAAGRALSSLANCLISFLLARKLASVGVWEQIRAHGLTLAGLATMSAAVLAVDAVLPLKVAESALLQVIALVSVGIVTYGATVLGVWVMTGRGDGPIAAMLDLAARFPALSAIGRLRRT